MYNVIFESRPYNKPGNASYEIDGWGGGKTVDIVGADFVEIKEEDKEDYDCDVLRSDSPVEIVYEEMFNGVLIDFVIDDIPAK